MLLSTTVECSTTGYLRPTRATPRRQEGSSADLRCFGSAASTLAVQQWVRCRRPGHRGRTCAGQQKPQAPEVRSSTVEAWQWWGAKNPEEWPELFECLMADARSLLKEFFGHDSFRPEQEKALRVALNRQDSEIYWPTAAGKSLIYQLVALLSWQRKRGIVIVVEPTIPVLQDQVQQFNSRAAEFQRQSGASRDAGPAMACLLGSAQKDEKIIEQAVSGKCCLVYMCPESMTQRYLEVFFPLRDSSRVSLFAVDEACYIPLWGNCFRPAFQDLAWLREAYESVPMLVLSGNAPPIRRRYIRDCLQLRNPWRSTRPMFRRNLQLEMHRCETDEKKLRMVLDLLESRKYPAVVYVPTKPDARRVRRRLDESLETCSLDLIVGYMDGETPPASRASINLDFQQGNIDVMVATDAYGQGIDKADIRLIVHWEPPVNLEMYVNHIGRAGRDGFTSTCLVLYSNSCWPLRFEDGQCFTKELEDLDEEEREVEFASRGALKDLVTSKKMCRWNQILKYYDCEDELPKEGCGSCDICLGRYDRPGEDIDFTDAARLLLSSIQLASSRGGDLDVLNLALGKADLGQLTEKQQELWNSMELFRCRIPLKSKQRQKGWLRELLNLLFTYNYVTKKYNGIHDVKDVNRKKLARKPVLKFQWLLTNKGHEAMIAKDAIRLEPSKMLVALDSGLRGGIRFEKELSKAYQEFKMVDRSDDAARQEALNNIIQVLESRSELEKPRETKKPKLPAEDPSGMRRNLAPDTNVHVWKPMYRQNQEGINCTLTLPGLAGVVEGTGGTREESFKMALSQSTAAGPFRIVEDIVEERPWIQAKLEELPCSPRDLYFEIVGVGRRRNGTVLFLVATLLFPDLEKRFRGNPCEHWALAFRSCVAAAKKGLALQCHRVCDYQQSTT